MPKIVAHYAKKLPNPANQFGNDTYSASVEAEIPSANPEASREALRRLFQTVRDAVDEQFRSPSGQNGHSAKTAPTAPSNGPRPAPTNGNTHNRFIPATQSQKKAVFAISKSLGLDPAQYDIERLSVKQASQLIDELKGQQAGR